MDTGAHSRSYAICILGALSGCDYTDTQFIEGAVEVNGSPLAGAGVTLLNDYAVCDFTSQTVTTDEFGSFEFVRTIQRSKIDAYVHKDRLCINDGDGWVVAWQDIYAPAPQILEFNCKGHRDESSWQCTVHHKEKGENGI